MSNVIGSGVIEVSADSRKLTAGIDEAKRSLKSLGIAAGDATKGQSQSIDRYVKSLGVAAVTAGKTARETELYRLALRGATTEQLKAADSALRMSEAYGRGEKIGQQVKTGLLSIGAAAGTGLIAAFVAFDQLTKKAGDFQDMAEKTGDTAQNIASLAVAAGTAGTSMESVVSASTKLTKGLTGVDDESKAAGAAIASLGLNIKDFKSLAPADQMESVAKALAGFQDGAEKTAVAMALFGKSGADLLPFLKELGAEGGRQVILTQEQIRQADEYADKQAKLRAEVTLHAQSIATEMLPAISDLTSLISDLSKDQEIAATASGILKGALSGATVVFQTIAVVASEVAFVFKGVGTEIGAIAAQIAALGRGDLKGFSAISDAVKQDMAMARAELDRFQSKVMTIGSGGMSVNAVADARLKRQGSDGPQKKKLRFSGATTTAANGKSPAEKEAKAQLGLDIENIKSAAAQMVGVYANAEKIMEAQRSAGLIDEAEYYKSKLEFLTLNNTAQEKALEDELARLQQEKLIGAEHLNNEKKIAETRAKLATVKAGGATGATVLGIQSEAAGTKRNTEVDKFFEEAQIASEARSIANVEAIRQSLLTQQQAEDEGYALRIEALRKNMDERLMAEVDGNALIEAEKTRHREAIESIQMSAAQKVLSIAQSSSDQLYSALKEAGLEQTALGKTMFIAQKAIQVASMIVQTEVAANAAQAGMIAAAGATAALSGPAGPGILAAGIASGAAYATLTRAMGYVSAGLVAGTAIAQASAEGGYDIPEGHNPLVQTHAKEMILPRAQANVIRDLAKEGGSKSGAITIVNNTSAKIGKVTEQTLSNGERAILLQEAVSATAAAMNDPNSKTSRSLQRNFATQRSR